MPKPDSFQGSPDLLKILCRRRRLHAYAIMTAIQEISGGILRAEGWIRAGWITKTNGRRARMVTSAVNRVLRMA